jgi:hypothetical protein
MQDLDQALRSSGIAAGGFLARDDRPLARIIAEDLASLSTRGLTPQQVGRRMQELTDRAKAGLGTEVVISDQLVVWCDEWKGLILCPWPHCGQFDKRVTTARRTDTGHTICWTDLNIHLIAEHGFFEGRGSPFRIEPQDLIELLFAGA